MMAYYLIGLLSLFSNVLFLLHAKYCNKEIIQTHQQKQLCQNEVKSEYIIMVYES